MNAFKSIRLKHKLRRFFSLAPYNYYEYLKHELLTALSKSFFKKYLKNTEIKNSKQSKTEQEITKGFVFDELGPLAGASISVKNTDLYTNTDFDGNFIFNKKLNVGDIIIVSYIGVKTKEYTISDLSKINISVESYFDGCIIMGEVGVKKVYKSKKTFFQKLKDIF